MTVSVPLLDRFGRHEFVTIVDDCDLHLAIKPALRQNRPGEHYVCVMHNGKRILLHRLIMGLEPGDPRIVDHIDRDPLNNTRANLQIVTHALNAQNQGARKASTSKFRGVCWDRTRQRWYAQVTLNGRNHNLGRFGSEIEAARAAAEFRRLHMPNSQEHTMVTVLSALRGDVTYPERDLEAEAVTVERIGGRTVLTLEDGTVLHADTRELHAACLPELLELREAA